MPLVAGQVLNNRYRIVKLLGQGGFGAVYRAWDMNMKAACAVKENFDTSPAAQSQFEREATLLFGLRHSGLPRVYDHFLVPNQGQYLVMDFIEGQDLQEMLDLGGPGRPPGSPLPEGQALAWIGQVAEALGYMHRQNPPVIHRDIKPANIVITPQDGPTNQGSAILVDFGIAKAYDPRFKTTLGARAVTPGYSPIEQYGQGTTDARSDVYSLGATLYTLLTGQVPQEATKRAVRDDLALAIQGDSLLAPSVRTILLRSLQMDADQRYADGYGFKAALPGAVQMPPTQVIHPASQPPTMPTASRTPSRGLLLGGAILAILVVVGGIWGWNTFGPDGSPTDNELSLQRTGTALAERLGALDETASAMPSPVPTRPPAATLTLESEATLDFPLPSVTLDDILATMTAALSTQFPTLELTPTSPGVSEKDRMVMVFVPTGPFLMGSNQGDKGTDSDEYEQHTVTLDAFWIDKTEVTNAMYALCVEDGACSPPSSMKSYTREAYYTDPQYADFPVIYVDWNDASAYCTWAGRRLPTEAEWEKAARGENGQVYPWGNQEPTCDLVNFDYGANDCVGDTTAVGSYPGGASPYGALDMAGNVWEWVSSLYKSYPYQANDGREDMNASGSRVLRGGSWYYSWDHVRAAARRSFVDLQALNVGFRCARSP